MSTQESFPIGDQVRSLREHSRRLARALGLMNSRVHGTECTPAQCHALIEISSSGALTATDVAERLDVDKSTASRTLQSLQRAGLLEPTEDPNDLRAKPMALTRKGRSCVTRIHATANEQVEGALALLSQEDRETVLRGVELYERALRRRRQLDGITIRPIKRGDQPVMARILRDSLTEFGAVGEGFSIHDAEIDSLQRAYAAPRSGYFVAVRDGQVLAGGGFAPLRGAKSKKACELRKMFALPEARGIGVGRRLLERCLDGAREAGFKTCYLETLERMLQARALYEKFGFQRLEGPRGNTGHHACDAWYELRL